MRNITPLRTYRDVDQMLESMERAFEGLWNQAPTSNPSKPIPIDLYEAENTLNVRASVPGIKPEEVEITFEKNVLTLRGEQKATWETSEAKVYHRENRYGQFTRSVRIPEGYQLDQASARFDNGVVTITIPKVEPLQPEVRRIPIQTIND